MNTGVQITSGIYEGWVSKYLHKAQLFYQSQNRKHQKLTWLPFCQHYQVPDYESPSNLGFDYEWVDWKEDYQLNDHFYKYQMTIQEFLEFRNTLSDPNNFEINDSISNELATYEEIDKIWFNSLID